jgi:hypothetical protein
VLPSLSVYYILNEIHAQTCSQKIILFGLSIGVGLVGGWRNSFAYSTWWSFHKAQNQVVEVKEDAIEIL